MAFFILLPLQYACVGIIGAIKNEPWPALVLPAFKSVYDSGKRISVKQLNFYAKNSSTGQVKKISASKLFPDLPNSQQQGFFRTFFLNSARVHAFGAKTKQWFRARLNNQLPYVKADELQLRWIRKSTIQSFNEPIHYNREISQVFTIKLQGR